MSRKARSTKTHAHFRVNPEEIIIARSFIMATDNENARSGKAHFRKAGHACGMTKKGHVLIHLGQLKDEIP